MNRNGLTKTLKKWSKPVLGAALALGVVFLIFGWRIGELPPKFSPDEKLAISASSSIKNIVNNPLYAPHKITQYGVQKLYGTTSASMRAVSVFFALISLAGFFLICRWWFKPAIAWMALALLALSPWLVINARSATTTIMFLSTIAVVTAYLWLQSSDKHHNMALIALAVTAVLSLYIPGVIWLTLVGILAVQKPLYNAYRRSAKAVRYSLPVIATLLATPLVYAVVYDPKLLRELFLVPSQFSGWGESASAVAWSGLAIVWRTRENLPTTLGTLPVLDALAVVLFIVGTFWLFTEYRRRRTYWLFGSLGVGIVLIGLNQKTLNLMLILPAVYIVTTTGLNFLHNEWFRVFPRNPLAKWVGLSVIIAVILISSLYSIRYSLIAWPRSPETNSYYVVQ